MPRSIVCRLHVPSRLVPVAYLLLHHYLHQFLFSSTIIFSLLLASRLSQLVIHYHTYLHCSSICLHHTCKYYTFNFLTGQYPYLFKFFLFIHHRQHSARSARRHAPNRYIYSYILATTVVDDERSTTSYKDIYSRRLET